MRRGKQKHRLSEEHPNRNFNTWLGFRKKGCEILGYVFVKKYIKLGSLKDPEILFGFRKGLSFGLKIQRKWS